MTHGLVATGAPPNADYATTGAQAVRRAGKGSPAKPNAEPNCGAGDGGSRARSSEKQSGQLFFTALAAPSEGGEVSDGDTSGSPDEGSSERVTRLSVNLASDVAEALKSLTRRRSISITEGVRRAIAVWKLVEDEQEKGNRIAIVEHHQDGTTAVREVVVLS